MLDKRNTKADPKIAKNITSVKEDKELNEVAKFLKNLLK
jgi:hypothetical protein